MENIIEEYLYKIDQREKILKELNKKKNQTTKIYDETIESVNQKYDNAILNLNYKMFEEVKRDFGENFEVNLERLKNNIAGKYGDVVFDIYARIPVCYEKFAMMEKIKGENLNIKFLKEENGEYFITDFDIPFDPEKELVNGGTLSDMVVFDVDSSGRLYPRILGSASKYMMIDLATLENFATQEISKRNYYGIKGIVKAIKEQKNIQENLANEEEYEK